MQNYWGGMQVVIKWSRGVGRNFLFPPSHSPLHSFPPPGRADTASFGLWNKPDPWNDPSENNPSECVTAEVLPLQSSWRPILMLILLKINKTKMNNFLIRKTLLLSTMKWCIMPFSIHRFFYSQKWLNIMKKISSSWRINESNFEWEVKIDTLNLQLYWQDT